MNKRTFLKRSVLAGILSQIPFVSRTSASENTEIKSKAASTSITSDIQPTIIAPRPYPAIGTIFHANFQNNQLPENWVQTGGFTTGANGLKSPATGGWNVYAYWNKLIALDEDMVSCQVEVSDVRSVFAIARISSQKKGTVAEVDFNTRKLKLYSELPAPGLAPAAVVAESDINFRPVAGRSYKLILLKVSEQYSVTLYDTVTQEVAAIDYLDTGKTPSSGKSWNFPGFIFRSGNVQLIDYTYSSGLPKSPKVLIIGDSIADGDTIRIQPNGGYKNRWTGLLAEALAYNVTIIARGGETSDNVNEKLPLIRNIQERPEYIIYAIGTNDRVFENWLTNYLKLKEVFEASGTEVIPATLFPRIGRESFCAEVNQYIKNSNSRFVDFGKALTQNGDYITRNEFLLLPDKLHPTPAGHLKMFNQVKINLPDLFL